MNQITRDQINDQFKMTKSSLHPNATVYQGLKEFYKLIKMFHKYLQGEFKEMDKKMHQVTKKIKTAEKEIRDNKEKMAIKTLKKAEVKNEKLVKIDKTQRDPIINEAKKVGKLVKKVK